MYLRDRKKFSWGECSSVGEQWAWGETLEPDHGHLGVLQKRPNFLLVDKKPLIFIIYLFSNIIWVFQVYLSSERYTGKMCGLFIRLLKHFKWEVIRNQNLGLDGGWRRKVDLKDIWKVNLIDFWGCCWIVWHACK